MKKRKNKNVSGMMEIARFGNFLLKKFGDGQNSWLRVMSVDGAWRMDFRDDSLKYGWIASCLGSGSDGVMRALEAWIIVSYHTAQVWPDPEYLDEAVGCLERLQKRVDMSKVANEDRKSDEDKIINNNVQSDETESSFDRVPDEEPVHVGFDAGFMMED